MSATPIDYSLATLIFIILFTLIAGYTLSLMYRSIDYTKNLIFSEKANLILEQILLSAGSPPDWGHPKNTTTGSSYEYPESFGLAAVNKTSYMLDPFKVCRLIEPKTVKINGTNHKYVYLWNPDINFLVKFDSNPTIGPKYYIPYEYTLQNLGLHDDYGFKMISQPVINIRHITVQYMGNQTVFNLEIEANGEPVPNAYVRGILVYGNVSITYPAVLPPPDFHAIPQEEFNSTYADRFGRATLKYKTTFFGLPSKRRSYVLLIAVSTTDTTDYYASYDLHMDSLTAVRLTGDEIVIGPPIVSPPPEVKAANLYVYQRVLSKESPTGFLSENLTFNQTFIEPITGNINEINVTILEKQSYIIAAVIYQYAEPHPLGVKNVIAWQFLIIPWGLPPQSSVIEYGGNEIGFTTLTYYRIVRVGECSYRLSYIFWRVKY